MSNDPHDPHNITAGEFRKFAGLPQDIKRDLREEKVDLATADIFQYIERVMYGGYNVSYGYAQPVGTNSLRAEQGEPNCYEVAISCCEALEKKGYSKDVIEPLRTYFTKMQAASEAQAAASKSLQKLSSERWDKAEIY